MFDKSTGSVGTNEGGKEWGHWHFPAASGQHVIHQCPWGEGVSSRRAASMVRMQLREDDQYIGRSDRSEPVDETSLPQ